MDCDSFYELGPPPDWILSLPPPPVPPHMGDFISRLASEGINIPSSVESGLLFDADENSCNMCHWADGNGVGFVELAQKGPIIDDTWFLVIISSCVGATLVGIIIALALFKYRDGKLKPLSDVVLAKKEKALGLERCEAVLYPNGSQDNRTSNALWAGLKTLEGNHYTVEHCQPMDQKPARLDLIPTNDATYDYADYSAMTYSSIGTPYILSNSHLKTSHYNGKDQDASFENGAYEITDEKTDKCSVDPRIMNRAAYLLGAKNSLNNRNNPHHYEMVTPQLFVGRKNKSLDRENDVRATPIISAPTNISTTMLPPLNSRYTRRYTFTERPNGMHTLMPSSNNKIRSDHKHMHVSLDRTGNANTNITDLSPSDHIYASPITSPVI